MENLQSIQNLLPVVWSERRVLTTRQLAEFYGVKPSRLKDNLHKTSVRFEQGVDYFKLEGEPLYALKAQIADDISRLGEPLQSPLATATNSVILYTEQGAARQANLIATALARNAFELLKQKYFAPDEPPVQQSLFDEPPKDNLPQIFNHKQFGQVRALNIDGEPFFVGSDVARALGYSRTADAIREHVPDKFKGVCQIPTPGGVQNMTVVNEAGVYKLIMRSKLPKAEEFSDWVCGEVLPSIRKQGFYVAEQAAPKVIAAVDLVDLQNQIDDLKFSLQAVLEALERVTDYSKAQLTKADRAERLLAVAERMDSSPEKHRLLLHAANLINGKKIF